MPRVLLALAAVQVFHWSGEGHLHRRPQSGEARHAKEVWITALVLVLFCGSSALADDFGLGTAGPGNWGVLETGTSDTVSFSGGSSTSPGGISVNPGASASQANVGINDGILPPHSGLNAADTTIIQGAYYMHSGNNDSITGGTIIAGGTLSGPNIDSIFSTAASDASAASTNLAGLANTQTPPSQIINSTTTIVGVAGRNVINIQQINLAGGCL